MLKYRGDSSLILNLLLIKQRKAKRRIGVGLKSLRKDRKVRAKKKESMDLQKLWSYIFICPNLKEKKKKANL